MTAQDIRDQMTAVWAVVAMLGIACVVLLGWGDFRAGWQESAKARASLGGQP